MEYYATTHVGKVRTLNEDAFLVKQIGDADCFLVCDGMGGHQHGEIASEMAVHLTETHELTLEGKKQEEILAALEHMVQDINLRIYLKSKSDPLLRGMGTTYSLAISRDNMIYFAHVGDSRIYLLGDDIRRMTTDHTYISELQKKGIVMQEVMQKELQNYITRAVGTTSREKAEVGACPVGSYRHMLLCTDGITHYVEDDELLETYRASGSLQSFIENVVTLCLARGGKDNITGIVTEIGEEHGNRNVIS